MKIYLGSDHAGFELKENVKNFLIKEGCDVEDCGAISFDKDDDYPDFVAKTAQKVAIDQGSKGIVFGKTGAGECIAANKIKGIRAVVGFSKENVLLSRLDNDANMLALGSKFIDEDLAKELIKIFRETSFSNEERHIRRIKKIASSETI